ncbi:MAG TPA: alpha/beta hydrolase [Rhizomicrobium sp.]|nr:alpha/beta hydrolase [Rhizomicrobium sp.]
MRIRPTLSNLIKGFVLAGALIAGSQAARPEELVTRDRFSDEIAGQGPDIVFIPGLASSRDTWKATAARLESRYRVHLIQVAGFAGEPARANASGPVLVPTAEAIADYLEAAHLAPAVAIGHSLGGTMLLYIAERHPEVLRKAMIVDSLPFYATLMQGPQATVESAKPLADAIRANPAGAHGGPRYEQALKAMAASDADRARIADWGKASDANAVINALADDLQLDLRPGLSAITTPLTLVFPDYAPLGAPAGANSAMYRAAYAAVRGMRFVEATHSLHFVMLDQPGEFAAALDAFLAD